MRTVMIGGVGMTRFGKFMDTGVRPLTEEAVDKALVDAGVEIGDVDMVVFGNAAAGMITGQEMIRGQVALRDIGLTGQPVINVENACASGSTAFHMAWLSVAAGQSEVALAIGAEKLTHQDKQVSFGAFEGAVDQEELRAIKERTGGEAGASTKSMFMDIYADMTRRYMQRTGATAQDLAQVAVKSHQGGARNPLAQYRNEVTVDEVLASRQISAPITLLMCSPIGDGAAAAIVMSEAAARRHGANAVRVRASMVQSGRGESTDLESGPARSAAKAYEAAGIGPDELDVVELHDATAPAELMIYEELGLCAKDGSAELLRSGATGLGGRVSVNPSGGLLSKGHPVGASGIAQIVELTEQLRGHAGERQREGAKVALAENAGGWIGNDVATANVTILST